MSGLTAAFNISNMKVFFKTNNGIYIRYYIVILWCRICYAIKTMTTNDAKKYCIDVIGMSDDDFTKATKDDAEYDDEINTGDWLHTFATPTECGDEYDSKTAVQIAKEFIFWNDPKNVEAYNNHLETLIGPE